MQFKILQENGEVICCVGSACAVENNAIFAQAGKEHYDVTMTHNDVIIDIKVLVWKFSFSRDDVIISNWEMLPSVKMTSSWLIGFLMFPCLTRSFNFDGTAADSLHQRSWGTISFPDLVIIWSELYLLCSILLLLLLFFLSITNVPYWVRRGSKAKTAAVRRWRIWLRCRAHSSCIETQTSISSSKCSR